MLLDSRCAGCDRRGPVICRACRLVLAVPPVPPGNGEVFAAVPFVGRARDVVLGFKYRNRREVGHHLAGLLVNRLVSAGVRPSDLDVVTWAPTTRRRRRQRGFDQAELVARRVALQLGLPCRRLLERDDDDGPQTGRDRIARLGGPAFRSSPRTGGRRILVVDDVVTTGATLRSAAEALHRGGARSVVRAAIATTPPAERRSAGYRPRQRSLRAA